jgi:hypothetical protein
MVLDAEYLRFSRSRLAASVLLVELLCAYGALQSLVGLLNEGTSEEILIATVD